MLEKVPVLQKDPRLLMEEDSGLRDSEIELLKNAFRLPKNVFDFSVAVPD